MMNVFGASSGGRRWLSFGRSTSGSDPASVRKSATQMMAAYLVAALLALVGLSLTIEPVAAQKAFQRDDLASDAGQLEAQVRASAKPPAGRTAAQLLADGTAAFDRGDPRVAQEFFWSAAALQPQNWQAWAGIANSAAAIEPRDYSERWALQERATAAGYLAYQRARSKADEAAALSSLANGFAIREMWRPALTAYKLSLSLEDNDEVRSTYEGLRAEHGFRITDYKVDSDSASPRVCFQLSEPLARTVTDYTPYVVVQGADKPAIVPDSTQLCVEGLEHGKRYAIVVRKGLPSSVDEELLENADFDIYVRDRAPQVRFTGRNYVLPRTAQEGIPVVTVNTEAVTLDVYRISDRNILEAIRSETFLKALSGYQAKEIAETRGKLAWTGTLETTRETNKDVITAFPVLDAIKTIEPGVYVMTAVPGVRSPDADGSGDDEWNDRATQWFVVSDLGLTAISGQDGLHVFAKSLADAKPIGGLDLELVAKNNDVLARGRSDDAGYIRFDPGLSRGTGGLAPGLLIARSSQGDYAFLDLQQTAFDLADRGVDGRPAPGPLDAFVAPERGVYRSGETVYATILLRDAKGAGASDIPVTAVVQRPDGVEYRRFVLSDEGAGGRALSVPLLSNAQRGTWRIIAYTDPKRPALGEATFLVEDYVPERLDVTLTPVEPVLRTGAPAEIDIAARYLFGTAGADLPISGEVSVSVAEEPTIPGLDGYSYGLDDESVEPVTSEITLDTKTDAAGMARVSVEVPTLETSRPTSAKIKLRVAELGGRAVERSVTLPIVPENPVIAIRPTFDTATLVAGANATFDVVMVRPDGTRIAATGLTYELKKIDTRWTWFNQEGRWDYEKITTARRLSDGTLTVTADAPGKLSFPMEWGDYRLEIRDPAGDAVSSLGFSTGYGGFAASAETPDTLDVALDKESYQAGETMKLRVTPRANGRATVLILSETLLATREIDVSTSGTTVDIPVDAAWGSGAYAVVLHHRPLDQRARRTPGRAIGLKHFAIDQSARTLTVDLGAPASIRPRGTLDLPVKVTGLTPGETAYITVAAVDVGILNLTGYETPDPSEYFFGQRRLGAEIRDLYGFLIDGLQGTRGQIRSGGDAVGGEFAGSPPREAPFARFSGVVTVGPDGTAQISFDVPAFNGTARVMAMAWTASKMGQAEADVIIRDPVVFTGTTPRFLNIGDVSSLFVQIDNVEGAAGDYTIDVDVTGPVSIPAEQARSVVKLETGGRTSLSIPIAAAGPGRALIDVRLTGPGGVDAVKPMVLGVQPATPAVDRRTVRPLAAGSSITVSDDLFTDFIAGTGRLSLSVAPLAALDVPSLLGQLDRYPYGCTEQVISRALPLLYVNDLATSESLALDEDAKKRVDAAIERVLSRQSSNGAFGLWSVGGDDIWLDAFVTDFLTRARETGYTVPQRPFEMALDRLRNHVANTQFESGGHDLAYAIYVLARNGRPVMGDLRYLADVKLADFSTPLAKAQIGAALALLGDRARAEPALLAAAEDVIGKGPSTDARIDFGSNLRDGAGVLALIAESGVARSAIGRVGRAVDTSRSATRFASTQELSWMVLAARALGKDLEKLTLTVDGQPHEGPFYRSWRGHTLDGKSVTVANTSPEAAQLVVSVAGHPITPEPAVSNQGYQVVREYYKLDGTKVDPARVKQNDRLVVVLKVTEAENRFARLLLVDLLPAGFEIDNPNLVESGKLEGLAWFKSEVTPVSTEYRDDRFVAAFDRDGGSEWKQTYMLAYMVRAVAPGRYVHPPASVEDMYRPERFGRTGFGAVTVEAAR